MYNNRVSTVKSKQKKMYKRTHNRTYYSSDRKGTVQLYERMSSEKKWKPCVESNGINIMQDLRSLKMSIWRDSVYSAKGKTKWPTHYTRDPRQLSFICMRCCPSTISLTQPAQPSTSRPIKPAKHNQPIPTSLTQSAQHNQPSTTSPAQSAKYKRRNTTSPAQPAQHNQHSTTTRTQSA